MKYNNQNYGREIFKFFLQTLRVIDIWRRVIKYTHVPNLDQYKVINVGSGFFDLTVAE